MTQHHPIQPCGACTSPTSKHSRKASSPAARRAARGHGIREAAPWPPLWPIVAAAVELLTHGTADPLKTCRACRFLYIDHSKNNSRRWCSMADCGKAAKIARYLRRRSDARSQEEPAAREQEEPDVCGQQQTA